jgi:hypothetical protein
VRLRRLIAAVAELPSVSRVRVGQETTATATGARRDCAEPTTAGETIGESRSPRSAKNLSRNGRDHERTRGTRCRNEARGAVPATPRGRARFMQALEERATGRHLSARRMEQAAEMASTCLVLRIKDRTYIGCLHRDEAAPWAWSEKEGRYPWPTRNSSIAECVARRS